MIKILRVFGYTVVKDIKRKFKSIRKLDVIRRRTQTPNQSINLQIKLI